MVVAFMESASEEFVDEMRHFVSDVRLAAGVGLVQRPGVLVGESDLD